MVKFQFRNPYKKLMHLSGTLVILEVKGIFVILEALVFTIGFRASKGYPRVKIVTSSSFIRHLKIDG